MAENSTGITVGFGTTSFSAELTGVSMSGVERTSLQTSHHGSSEHTFIPGDLVNYGEVTCEIQWDPDTAPPIDADAETITITFPNGAKIVGSAFVTSYDWDAPLEEITTGSFTFKWAGEPTVTSAPA